MLRSHLKNDQRRSLDGATPSGVFTYILANRISQAGMAKEPDMAETPKKSFPRLPISAWWKLRKQFKQSIPGVVTDSYLATVLGMKADSARSMT